MKKTTVIYRAAGELLPHGRFLFQIFIIGDIRNLEPAGEAAAADLGQNHAVVGIGGMDDLTVPDIYPDVTLMPESQTRRFGERIDRAFLRCIFVHGVRTDIGHTVCTVCDTAAFTVVPAVVLNQSDAVRSPSAEPMCLDKVCLAADLIGVLLGFRVQRFLSKHFTVGSPYNVLLQYFFVVEWLVDGIEQGELAERPGENGRKAYEYTLEKSSGEEAGIRPAFLACYTYGLAGSPMENVPEEFKNALSGDAAYRAWASGQNDAAISLRNDQEKVKFASLAGEDSGLVYDDFVNEAVRSGRSRVDVNEENRTYLSAETAEQINETAKALGLRVQFADSVRGGTANAQISGDTILIEKDNPNPVLAIAGHEFGHRLQELAPEEYRRFRERILEGREQEIRDKAAQYAKLGVNVTYEEAMNEVANDQAGLLMDGGEVLDRFIEQHRSDRTLLQKMRDAIRSFIDKVTGKERKRLETAEGKLEAALKAAAKQAKALQDKVGRDTMDVTRHSLKEDENNGIIEENHRATQISGNYRDSGYDAQQKTADTGRSGQNRQGVGSEVRSEVGSTVRREDFLREHRERGDRSVRLKGKYLYAYHEATETELNDDAKKTVEILKDLDIPYFTNTDGLHIYANGNTRTSTQSVTIHDGANTKIAVSANMETEGVATAYHEAFHFLRDVAPALRAKLQETIRENIVENKSYEAFSSRIAEAYQIPLDSSQRTEAQEAKFQEELNAYICGEIMAQNPGSEALDLIKDFVKNPEQLLTNVAQMYTDFKTQQKGNAKFSLKTGTITKSYEAVLEENRLLKEQMKDYRSLKKQNRNLKENRDYWKGQTKTTKEVTTDRKAVEKAAAELLKSYSSEADVSDIQERLQNLYDSIARGDEGVSYEEAWKRAEAIAESVIDKAVAKESLGESYQELLSYLKDTKIRVEEGTKSDIPDYSAFQRQQKGRLSLNSQDGAGIDQVYLELAERWPEFFDETEYTNPSDQLLQIADVADQLRQVEEYNPFEGDGMDQVVAGAANEILERTPAMLNMDNKYVGAALDLIAEHRGQTLDTIDPSILYDEFNAMMYGSISIGNTNIFQSGKGSGMFHNFDAYAKELTELHERFKAENQKDSRFSLKAPVEETRDLGPLPRRRNMLRAAGGRVRRSRQSPCRTRRQVIQSARTTGPGERQNTVTATFIRQC